MSLIIQKWFDEDLDGPNAAIAQPLSGTLSFAGAVTKNTSYPLAGTLSFIGALAKRTSHVLAGTLSFIGAVTKRTSRALTGMLKFISQSYLSFPGTAGQVATTPDSVAISITGDIDIRVRMSSADWTPSAGYIFLSKMQTGNDRAYRMSLLLDGTIAFEWSTDGTVGTLTGRSSTALVPAVDGSEIWLRCTLDVDNGAGGNDTKFYTSIDGTNWTQLGTTVTVAGVTSIFDAVDVLSVGAQSGTTLHNVYYAEIRNGIGGTVVAKFDPDSARISSVGSTTFKSPTGEVWTVFGTTVLTEALLKLITTAKALTGALSFVGTLTKRTNKAMTATLNFVGAVTKLMSHVLTGTLSFIGAVTKRTSRALTGMLEFISQSYVLLPGTANNYATTPDSVANSITGDIDIRIRFAADDWTPSAIQYPLAKYNGVPTGSYLISIPVTGQIGFNWVDSGGNFRVVGASIIPTFANDGKAVWLRITLDVDNGAGGHTVTFYTSTDATNWIQLGTTVNAGAFTTSIQDGADTLNIGAWGNTGGNSPFAGKVYYAELRNGINGPVVVQFDPDSARTSGVTSFTAPTGEVWTIVGTASLVEALRKILATTKALTGALSFVGTLTKRTNKALTGALNFIGTVTKLMSHVLTGTLSFIGAVTKRTTHVLASTLSFIGDVTKRTNRALTGVLSFIGAFAAKTIFTKALAGTLSFIGALSKQTGKSQSATLSFIGTLTKHTSYVLAATLSFVGDVTKRTNRALTGVLSFVGVFAAKTIFTKALAATLSFVGALSKQTGKSQSATLSFVGAVTKRTSHILIGTLSFVGAVTKRTNRALTGTLSFVGTVTKNTIKALAAILNFVGVLGRVFIPAPIGTLYFKSLAGTLSFVGSLPQPRLLVGKIWVLAARSVSWVITRAVPIRAPLSVRNATWVITRASGKTVATPTRPAGWTLQK